MFRLISLNLNDPVLGHIPDNGLVFIPGNELSLTDSPYSTVIIGPNGTGKSTLLAYVGRIFEDIKYYNENEKRNTKGIAFPYTIKYRLGNDVFTITQKNNGLDRNEVKKSKRSFKWSYDVSINGIPIEFKNNAIGLPEQVIAVSYLPMDRFRQKKNVPDDFYQYLGLRHRSNAASPQYFLNNTLPLLFNYITEKASIEFLKSILQFMSMDSDYLGVELEYRYKKFFFTGDLTVNRFTELFENPSSFSRREATSFASLYYQRYIKNDRLLLKKIVGYLNTRAKHDHITVGEMSLLEFNLFGNSETIEDLSLIQHLQKLDLLASASLRFRKGRSTLDSQDLSSGEFHFLSTMIAIQATIRKNCLILIDEPETSLHPNWQMKYVDTLKQLFKEWNSCHFIMTTHSHFIISDLENDSSEIIGLKGQVPSIKAKPFNTKTYGYSAEEILLDIFEVSTTRNQFIYEKVGEILELIALPESNQDDIADKVKYLKQKGIDRLSKEDPLKEVIDKLLEKYDTAN